MGRSRENPFRYSPVTGDLQFDPDFQEPSFDYDEEDKERVRDLAKLMIGLTTVCFFAVLGLNALGDAARR